MVAETDLNTSSAGQTVPHWRRPGAAGKAPSAATWFVTKYWQLFLLRLLTGVSLGGIFPLVRGPSPASLPIPPPPGTFPRPSHAWTLLRGWPECPHPSGSQAWPAYLSWLHGRSLGSAGELLSNYLRGREPKFLQAANATVPLVQAL